MRHEARTPSRGFPCRDLAIGSKANHVSRHIERRRMNIREPALTPALDGSLEIYLLGLVDFDAALSLQERLVLEIAQHDDGRGALLICEHPPLITIGREGSQADILCESHELVARQIEVRWLN